MELKTPTPDLVREYNRRFEQNDNLINTEKAIHRLVKAFPDNRQIEEVLLKVAAINSLYSTNLYAVFKMAQHIVAMNVDPQLERHDPEVISKIANLKIKEKNHTFYSFSTKYCSWHAPDGYPIYDSFVDRMLCLYRKQDNFANFTSEKLRDYPTFRSIIQTFQQYYGLTEFSFKEVDKFLWVYGKENSE
jgi:hypothetical protein